MDRYFYSVEMMDGQKVVHMSGNVYLNDANETETCFRIAEWTGLYITVKELKDLLSSGRLFEYPCEEVAYLGDLTEGEAIDMCKTYFGGTPGVRLHITHVNEDTPCGDYWFE